MVNINSLMKYGDILKQYPQLKPIFRRQGIPVSSCGIYYLLDMTLEQLAQRYNLDTETLLKALQRGY
ncbi:MAG TPA: hypothetical protein GX523_10450 [Desulfitobacterium dehalogenans]|uniref:DUF1858 domain-containing protein n=1 Tax=Desulfitobacterium dehalogenans TaxID=36854 RepID=A0A7C6Z4S0_9FIRM|nr:hypothetical protein [Desulfitobacterium dehalogenans]